MGRGCGHLGDGAEAEPAETEAFPEQPPRRPRTAPGAVRRGRQTSRRREGPPSPRGPLRERSERYATSSMTLRQASCANTLPLISSTGVPRQNLNPSAVRAPGSSQCSPLGRRQQGVRICRDGHAPAAVPVLRQRLRSFCNCTSGANARTRRLRRKTPRRWRRPARAPALWGSPVSWLTPDRVERTSTTAEASGVRGRLHRAPLARRHEQQMAAPGLGNFFTASRVMSTNQDISGRYDYTPGRAGLFWCCPARPRTTP